MSDAVDHGSISSELEGIDLGDKRLNKRCKRLIEALAVDPQLSINASCNGWNETHAAYELLDHSKTTPAKILHPHQMETLRRIQQHPVVLIPQDTTELDYTAHPAKDARCLNKRMEYRDHDGPRAEFITRAQQARSTVDRDLAAGPQAFCKVLKEVRESALLGTRTIELPATPKRKARPAVLELRALTITVKPPHGRAALQPVTMNIVLVEEVGGPGDGTDVSWQLLTSLSIDTLEAAWLVVDYYRQRWTIEVYFKTLKTGCRVEAMRLETTARLKNALALYEVIAWRILYLTHLNRTNPKTPCDQVFAEHEWKSVWSVTKRIPLPLKPPTLAEFLRLLTSLGGYNNRATERPPGPLPFWLGLRRMHDLAIAFQIFKTLPES